MTDNLREINDYAKEFCVIAYGMAGQVMCVKKHGKCDISITKDECRECLEENNGLKDVFNGD